MMLAAAAVALYLCITPTGWVEVATLMAPPGPAAEALLSKMLETAWQPPAGSACRWAELADLPPSTRPDPRHPTETLTQRHRWRGLPDGRIVLDPAARRPHGAAIRREVGALLPSSRLAQVLSTPLGHNLMRVLREEQWPLATALVRQARGLAGTPQEVFTPAELDELGRIGDDYEWDLR